MTKTSETTKRWLAHLASHLPLNSRVRSLVVSNVGCESGDPSSHRWPINYEC